MYKLIPEFAVADVVETSSFYSDVLGFQVTGLTGRGEVWRAGLRCGQVEIAFMAAPDRFDTSSQTTLYIYVDDVAALYEQVVRRAPVLRALERTLFSAGEFAIRDNNGMVLHFIEPIDRPAHAT